MPANLKSELILVLLQSWEMFTKLWYYIVGGIFAGAAATALIPTHQLSKVFSKPKSSLLPAATILGMASPVCTYGTVPFIAGLLKQRMPPGPAAAFLVASAAINPQIFVLTAGTLGLEIALCQAIAVFIVSLLIGTIVTPTHLKDLSDVDSRDNTRHLKHHPHGKNRSPWKDFYRDSLGIAEHVSLYFLLGIIAANAILVFSRGTFFNAVLGTGRWYAVPLAGALSIPLYACGGAAVPVLAVGANNGMSQGAILAFLLIGPTTRIAPLTGMTSIFTKRAVLFYSLLIILFSIGCGLLYDIAIGTR